MITLAICWEAVIIALVTIILDVSFVLLLIAALNAASENKLWGKIVVGIILIVMFFIVFYGIYTIAAMDICH